MSHEKDRAVHHGGPAQPLNNPTKDCSDDHIAPSATELVGNVLSYTPDEYVSITYRASTDGPVIAAIIAADDATRYLREVVPPAADVWFGVNPVSGPARPRVNGTADDVTRLAALWADLDFKNTSRDTAAAIIADLSGHLGTQPTAIVNSGNGLHPYWPVDGCAIDDTNRGQIAAVLRRWGRLVKLVAKHHNTGADNVFDLPRILRVPGTTNQKYTPAAPVTLEAAPGGPITADRVAEVLDELGVAEHQDDSRVGDTTPVTEPSNWRYAEKPCCAYTGGMVKGWASDTPTGGRHPWLLAQATRLAAAHALGCLTAEQHRTAADTLTDRFTELCQQGVGGDPRAAKRYEISDAVEFGQRTAARKTRDQLLGELGGAWEHWHLQTTTKHATPQADTPVSGGQAAEHAQPRPNKLRMVRASTIADDVPEWVWANGGRGRIQKGTVTLFSGRPGAGKSTAARWFAAGWTTGTLTGCWEGQPVNVAYVATEEAWHHTVVPSLRAAGADMDRVFFIERKEDDSKQVRAITDKDDLIEHFIADDVRAVFVDPLMGSIDGGADINRNNEVRDYLAPWVQIAEAIDGTVIGICHMTKAPTGDVVASITGSSAFGEVARCVFGFAIDKECEEGTRVMSQAKNSAGFEDLSLAYRIGTKEVTTSTGKVADMARFEMLGPTERTVRELLIAERSSQTRSGTDDCARWLKGYLTATGQTAREDILTEAAELGFNAHMVRRAGYKVGVQTERTRTVPPRTFWSLPVKAAE